MTAVDAVRVGPWWRVTVTTIDAGVWHQRTVTGRRYAHIMRQLAETP